MKKDSKIIFFHGYGSSGTGSNTGKMLSEEFGENVISCPTYNYCNAVDTNEYLTSFVLNIVNEYEDVLFVGHSLGGFWANRMSEIFQKKALLINPSLDPVSDLARYSDVDLNSFKEFYIDTQTATKIIVVGTQDEVIPFKKYFSKWENKYTVYMDPKMTHRVSEISSIKYALKKLKKL